MRASAMDAAERMKSPAKMAFTHTISRQLIHLNTLPFPKHMKREAPERTHLFLPPHLIDRGFASPCICTVNDIIVYQAGRVDHLGDHGDGALGREQIPDTQ